jgi:heme-degrading monooxygenase HmoA
MISRHWKGVAKLGHAEAYLRHLRSETFSRLAGLPGFVEASVLRREVDGGTEFLVVTVWDSMKAVEAFAGPDVDVAVVPAAVQAMLSSYDERVRHFEMVDRFSAGGGD